MAVSCLRTSGNLIKRLISCDTSISWAHCQVSTNPNLLTIVRHGSFFNRHNADHMWKTVTTVSSQGRRRGRGQRLMKKIDLGVTKQGRSGLVFPGFNVDMDRDSTNKVYHDESLVAPEIEAQVGKKRSFNKISPLERGYSGNWMDGRILEKPNRVGDYDFDGFATAVLKTKTVGEVSAAYGIVHIPYAIVATGNKQGIIGLAYAKGSTKISAIRTARKRAAQRLVYVDLHEGHTIRHNFMEQNMKTKVIAYGMHKGYGLVCHRVIKLLCQMVGIQDIYVKVEGNERNYLAVSRAFIRGLINQKSFQDIADETGHHVVEYRQERENFPYVVASPSPDANKDFERPHMFDFEEYCFGGKRYLMRKRQPPYAKLAEYGRFKMTKKKKNLQHRCKMDRMLLGLEPEYKQ